MTPLEIILYGPAYAIIYLLISLAEIILNHKIIASLIFYPIFIPLFAAIVIFLRGASIYYTNKYLKGDGK